MNCVFLCGSISELRRSIGIRKALALQDRSSKGGVYAAPISVMELSWREASAGRTVPRLAPSHQDIYAAFDWRLYFGRKRRRRNSTWSFLLILRSVIKIVWPSPLLQAGPELQSSLQCLATAKSSKEPSQVRGTAESFLANACSWILSCCAGQPCL